MEITPQMVDAILYNLRMWQKYVRLMEPRTSASVILLPVRTSRAGSAVERVAVRRATISVVLDTVSDALRDLPPDLRKIAKYNYEYCMSYREIARRLTREERRKDRSFPGVTKSTVARKVNLIRDHVISALSLLNEEIVGQFWDEIGTIMGQ